AEATLEGSRIEGAKAPFGYGALAQGSSLTLKHSVISGSASIGVFVADAPVAIIDDGKITGNLGGGLRAERSRDVTIAYTEFADNAEFGVGVFESVAIIDDGKITGTVAGAVSADGLIVMSPQGGMQSNVTVRSETIEG